MGTLSSVQIDLRSGKGTNHSAYPYRYRALWKSVYFTSSVEIWDVVWEVKYAKMVCIFIRWSAGNNCQRWTRKKAPLLTRWCEWRSTEYHRTRQRMRPATLTTMVTEYSTLRPLSGQILGIKSIPVGYIHSSAALLLQGLTLCGMKL